MQSSVEILAGKCNWDGRLVTPDTRKGKLVLGIGDDGLTHIQWICRTNNAIEENLIVIGDAYLEKIPQAKTGRVYVLRFTSSDKKLLFWMQNADTSKDAELVQKFNSIIGAEIPETPVTTAPAEISPLLPQSTEDAASMRVMADNFIQMLQQIPAYRTITQKVSLSSILETNNCLRELLTDEKALEELFTHLPPGYQNLEGFLDALSNPQLTHNMNLLTQAIYSEQLLPTILSSMGISYPSLDASAPTDPMEILVNSLEKADSSTPPASDQPSNNTESIEPSHAENDQEDVKMGNDEQPPDAAGS